MRKVLFTLVFLLVSTHAWAQTWTNVTGTAAACSGTVSTSSNLTVSTGQFLVAYLMWGGNITNPTGMTITDTQGNTWVASPKNATVCTSGSNGCLDRWYAIAKSNTADSITVTAGVAGTTVCASAVALAACTSVNGTGQCPITTNVDQSANGSGNTSTPNTGTTGSTTQAFEMVVGSVGEDTNQNPTGGPAFIGTGTGPAPTSIVNIGSGAFALWTGAGSLYTTGTTGLQWTVGNGFYVGTGDTFQVANASPVQASVRYNWAPWPFSYTSPINVGSGVVSASPGALVSCNFYNSGASAEYFALYDSKTVAGEGDSNMICATKCAGTSFCTCPPNTVYPPGSFRWSNGTVVKNGISWGNSGAYPGPTASPDPQGSALCTYLIAQ